jgi:hypothetical protein
MIFVLDTSELHDEKRLDGNLLRLFLLAKALTKQRVCLPEVVIGEHLRASRDAMQRSVTAIEKELRVLSRYWGKLDVKLPALDHAYEKWRLSISDRLRAAGVEILPYPCASHQSITERDLERRKPFSESGKGYRDALIWESVLDLAAKSDDQIVFVTSNSKDFADGEALHPDLVCDLAERNLQGRVSLALGLSSALEKHLKQMLPPIDQPLRAALERGPADGIDLAKWALQELKEVCPRLVVPPTAGIEDDHVQLSAVTKVDSIRVREARRFQTGEVFVEMELTIKASVTAAGPVDPFAKTTLSDGWKLLGTLVMAVVRSQSSLRMSVALTFDRERLVVAADVWDVTMLPPFASSTASA